MTYINSAASIKAFVGERGGTVCTSSNAMATLKWAFARGEKVLFLPDQHLGRNTAYKMGIPLDEMVVWDPNEIFGGLDPEQVQRAKMILWKGHCSVHERFTAKQIEGVRAAASRHPRDRASRGAVGRRAGRRRQRQHRVHHQDGHEQPGRLDLGRRHRGAPGQSAGQQLAPEPNGHVARSVRLPLLDDVPRVAEPPAVDSGRAGRGRVHNRIVVPDEQKHWNRVALDRMLSIS